jgi:hypothetical protein
VTGHRPLVGLQGVLDKRERVGHPLDKLALESLKGKGVSFLFFFKDRKRNLTPIPPSSSRNGFTGFT